ncbi:MAG: hypothetical protein ACRC6V_10210 [Bacteroidales bacterium]
MKTTIYRFLSLITIVSFIGALSTSCSSKDEGVNTSVKQEVTFQLDAKTVMDTKAAIDGYAECNSDNVPMQVTIELTGTENKIIEELVTLYGDSYKTAPVLLKSGEYTVVSVTVHNGSNVIYSGVSGVSVPLPEFAAFIPSEYLMGVQKFTVTDYTKPTIPLYVLCAQGEPASKFGMPKFQINRIEVNCFDLFFNVCDPEQGNEHIVGSGTIELWTEDGESKLYSDSFGSQNIATLCFADDLTITDNSQEKYRLVVNINPPAPLAAQKTVALVSVESLLKYKDIKATSTTSGWDDQMNAIHVIICGGNPFCLPIPGVICDGEDPDPDPTCDGLANLYDNFNVYSSINGLFVDGPWAKFNGASLNIPSSDTSLGLQLESNNGKNKQYTEMSFVAGANDATVRVYEFQTKRFKFSQGQNIAFEHWLRSVRTATANDKHKFIAKATLELWNDFGVLTETKIDWWSTPNDEPLSATGNGDWHYVPAPKYKDPFPNDQVPDGCYYLKIKVEIMPTEQKKGDPVIFEEGRRYYLGIDNLVKYSGENPNQI